jgi:hypothetical protein
MEKAAQDLNALMVKLVGERRATVEMLNNQTTPEGVLLQNVVDLQNVIDALKRALEDEKSRSH